jgi:hypothetical protein
VVKQWGVLLSCASVVELGRAIYAPPVRFRLNNCKSLSCPWLVHLEDSSLSLIEKAIDSLSNQFGSICVALCSKPAQCLALFRLKPSEDP